MTSALMPEPSIWLAIDFIVAVEPLAFWMSQSSLYFVHAVLRAAGSAVTHLGDEVVSGRMMPTFAPPPSTAPPEDAAALDAGTTGLETSAGVDPPPGGCDVPPLLPLELHAARA